MYFSKHNVVALCLGMYETNYRLQTTGMHATVLTVETGKWTTGIGADTKISIGRYWYQYRYRSNPIWHCWFGHPACKNRRRNDLLCVEWDVKHCTLTHAADTKQINKVNGPARPSTTTSCLKITDASPHLWKKFPVSNQFDLFMLTSIHPFFSTFSIHHPFTLSL